MQGDAVEDRAHRVLADAEVQHPAGVGVALEHLGGAVGRAGTTARPRSWCCWSRRGRPSRPTARAACAAIALMTLPGRDPGRHALLVGLPRRQVVGPAVGQPARLDAMQQLGAARGRRPPTRCTARPTRRPPRSPARPARRVCSSTPAGTSKVCSGSKPRISLVAATSSSPSAEPWALPVFCGVGSGPRDDRAQHDEARPVGDGVGRVDRRRTAPRRPRRTRRRRGSSRRSARASRRPRSGPRRPRSARCRCRPRSRSGWRRRSG